MAQPPVSTSAAEQLDQLIDIAPAASGTINGKKRANEDGEEDESGGKKAAKRNRKPVSCAQCRRRKLKCDRGYPCGACRDRQEGHLCEWEGAIRLPQPHLTRDAEAQELRLQLDRLESLLGSLGSNPAALAVAAAAGAGTGTPSGSGGPPTDEKNAAEALGLLAANPAAAASPTAASSSHRTHLLATATSVSHLVTLLPMKKELESLVRRFLTSELLFFPVVHQPTFEARVKEYTNATAPDHPFLLALLLAIAAFEMGWQLTEPGLSRIAGIEKDHAARRFFEASSEALRMGGYTESPNLDVVRTLLVLYRCAEQQLDPRGAYFLSQAIQIAQTLGLNRDPESISGFNQIEIQERRRLWHILVGFDWLDQSGRLPTITTTQYDTLEPASAYDKNITATHITTHPWPAFTPSLYHNLLNQVGVHSHAISEEVYAVKPSRPLTWGRVDELNAGLESLKGRMPKLDWAREYVQPLTGDNVFESDRFRVQAHSAILQLTLRLNRPFLTRGLGDERLATGRERCITAAHKLLGIWLGYPDSNAISRLPLITFHALNALLICAIDLFQAPGSKYVDKHRRLIANVTMKLNGREHKPKIVADVAKVVQALQKASTKPADLAVMTAVGNPLPSTFTFSRPFPLPMTLDPFTLAPKPPSSPAASGEQDLSAIWNTITSQFRLMYAVPDRTEWEELITAHGQGQKPWAKGVDLVTPPSQAQGQARARGTDSFAFGGSA
ncbi:hypothetical protein JCM11251_001298 [Rhodosporidiobolus azoricus]